MIEHKTTLKRKGFSLLEVLLSVFVMSVGLMTIVAVINGSLAFSYDTRDNIIATELAQEGVELVRNVRDNDFAAGNDGFTDFNGNEHCRIDWDDAVTSLDCNGGRGAQSRYYLQYSGGIYAHVNLTEERYSRLIYIEYRNNGAPPVKRALVRSFVVWGNFTTETGDIPANGDPTRCQNSPTCVYTETFLTSWR